MKSFKNKASILVVAASLTFFVSTIQTHAQNSDMQKKAEFGIRFMPAFTSLTLKTAEGGTVSGDVTLGFGLGVLLGFNFSNHIGVQTEVIYNSLSQKSKDAQSDRKITLKYVNVPLLFSVNTGKSKVINLNLVAGPQIGFNLGSSLTVSGVTDINNPQPVLSVKKGDLGFAYGAGVDFGLNAARTVRLGLGYRGVFGLLDISNKSNTVITNSYYVLDRTKLRTHAVYAGLSILF
ncbi:MAG: PorT family protein [Bacteroidia bacterium]|nr:PorT family protein [Bacteroidia bacterium]